MLQSSGKERWKPGGQLKRGKDEKYIAIFR